MNRVLECAQHQASLPLRMESFKSGGQVAFKSVRIGRHTFLRQVGQCPTASKGRRVAAAH